MILVYKVLSKNIIKIFAMSVYDEVEIEDMDYDTEQMIFFYPCPCGDKFRLTLE